MTLGDDERARLRKAVPDARRELTTELTAILEAVYGVHRDGTFEPVTVGHLPVVANDARARETRELLERVLPPPPTTKPTRDRFASAFDALVRELAFTHLNRLVAFKMMEDASRKLVAETVGRSAEKRGLLKYLADHPDDEALYREGKQDVAYQRFLLARCAELHHDIGHLFDPEDLPSRLFPRHDVISRVREILNADDLAELWRYDEALGWVYQYYTPKDVRDEAKEEGAPQSSFELAVRNQFYTPEYVVRFLTDNTLGRLWLEMLPASALRDECKYLLVRPDESLPPRTKKDPREIRVLDPACGSGHFLLYAFDLFETIYVEAWDDPDLGEALRKDFRDRESFARAVPALIVEHNLHGIDIDLRATQIASLALYLKARSRQKDTRLRHTHIVCAEPMPGDAAALDEFLAHAYGTTTGVVPRVLRGLWEHLQLAGEAGSLLRVEDEIARLVSEERKHWQALREKGGQQLFPSFMTADEQLHFGDVTEDRFWATTEQQIEELLRRYADGAAGAEGARRRMFAQDGVQGLRFVEAMRRRYDVVLMNPPFGESAAGAQNYVASTYPSSCQDVFACFVERALLLVMQGFVGCLSPEAGFYLRGHESWRRTVVLARSSPAAVAHFGGHVLDGAIVRTVAFVLRAPGRSDQDAVFLRLLDRRDRAAQLHDSVGQHREGQPANRVHVVNPSEFEKLPYAVFGYWCSARIRLAFQEWPSIEAGVGAVRRGMSTGDDSRFIRLRWEPRSVGVDAVGRASWRPLAKGGEYSPYHEDIHLCVPWASGACTLHGYVGRPGRETARPEAVDFYFLPGLTYPRRTAKPFAPRLLPAGCVLADKGPAIIPRELGPSAPIRLLAILNSRTVGYLLSICRGASQTAGGAGANSYEVDLVGRLPIPASLSASADLDRLSLALVSSRRAGDRQDECSAIFVRPCDRDLTLAGVIDRRIASDVARRAEYAAAVASVDDLVLRHYGFGSAEKEEIERGVGPLHQLAITAAQDVPVQIARRIISWAVGVAFGRWDVRFMTGALEPLNDDDPFAPVTGFSPGMLRGDPPSDYPVAVDRDGILVDDEGHEDDLVARVGGVLRAVWGEGADELERDVCRTLGHKTLPDYFRKPTKGGFFGDHVYAYSKSRRRAPIYWILQSSKKSYGVWLYYPKLDGDSLFKVLGKRYLGSRILRTQKDIDALRRPGADPPPKLTPVQEREVERLEDLLAELRDFEAAIRRVVELPDERGGRPGYAPDLDDGVLLNAAPLHELIPWPVRSKGGKSELTETWEALAGGEYDWAKIAMRYWPDRVRRACEKDRSFAIAHGLEEELFPTIAAEPSVKRKSKKTRKGGSA